MRVEVDEIVFCDFPSVFDEVHQRYLSYLILRCNWRDKKIYSTAFNLDY